MKHQIKKIYSYGPDSQQFAHLYKPEFTAALPVVIIIHGGYWKDNHTLDSYATSSIVDYLKECNVAIWNLEYRRMEAEGVNTKALWPATFEDVAAGLDFLSEIAQKEGLDLSRTLLIGHSAGGLLSAWAASRKNIATTSLLYREKPLYIQRTISISGVLNLFAANELDQPEQINRLMGGSEHFYPERYQACDPASLHHEDVKITLVHGEQDTCVNVSQTQRYCQKARTSVRQIIMPEADHFSMLPHDGSWQMSHWQQVKQLITSELARLS